MLTVYAINHPQGAVKNRYSNFRSYTAYFYCGMARAIDSGGRGGYFSGTLTALILFKKLLWIQLNFKE